MAYDIVTVGPVQHLIAFTSQTLTVCGVTVPAGAHRTGKGTDEFYTCKTCERNA